LAYKQKSRDDPKLVTAAAFASRLQRPAYPGGQRGEDHHNQIVCSMFLFIVTVPIIAVFREIGNRFSKNIWKKIVGENTLFAGGIVPGIQ
jgi:hypothetical protein